MRKSVNAFLSAPRAGAAQRRPDGGSASRGERSGTHGRTDDASESCEPSLRRGFVSGVPSRPGLGRCALARVLRAPRPHERCSRWRAARSVASAPEPFRSPGDRRAPRGARRRVEPPGPAGPGRGADSRLPGPGSHGRPDRSPGEAATPAARAGPGVLRLHGRRPRPVLLDARDSRTVDPPAPGDPRRPAEHVLPVDRRAVHAHRRPRTPRVAARAHGGRPRTGSASRATSSSAS